MVDLLVDEAVRSELVLGAAERRTLTAKANAEYLSRGVRYDGERLIDAADDAVMMQWEEPLMEEHAERLCAAGGDVLNVGFGMGIIDSAIARRAPRSHTIIEAHPDVLARMRRDGWAARPGVRVLEGSWQQVLPRLCDAAAPPFDAIFFDTFAEGADELFRLHALLPRLLRPGGRFSYFNGLASHDEFLHRVYCAAVQRHLAGLGLRATFEPIAVGDRVHSPATWEGAEAGRNWWHFDTYLLPVCVRD